jgi:CBS domain containing-hemolysin-like protein
VTYDYTHEPLAEAKQEIYEILQESDIENKLQPENKKIIEAVVTFQELIAREVMVPRVDLFALPSDISIRAAAKKIEAEGYSRIPVYRGTIDQVIGLLMYKDIISKYMESENKRDPHILDQPIETILKSVFYTPETKKISQLLQEFRRKQMHMAIVVDEYGGTEGIVTIEDILEQIVGRIEDEYDTEEDLFVTLADGNYIVDGRMSILHLEELLDIEIPEEGDYDTIGGYIFYKAGEIPTRGFTIKHDTFELEVLRASDRSIEKVKVIKKA